MYTASSLRVLYRVHGAEFACADASVAAGRLGTHAHRVQDSKRIHCCAARPVRGAVCRLAVRLSRVETLKWRIAVHAAKQHERGRWRQQLGRCSCYRWRCVAAGHAGREQGRERTSARRPSSQCRRVSHQRQGHGTLRTAREMHPWEPSSLASQRPAVLALRCCLGQGAGTSACCTTCVAELTSRTRAGLHYWC